MQNARNLSRGYIAVDRSLFDDPLFASEPFTELHAFLWMTAEAAWQPRTVRCGRALVHLQRGQLAYATRFLAVKFCWSDARVRRFLKRAKRLAARERRTDRHAWNARCDADNNIELRHISTFTTHRRRGKRRSDRCIRGAPATQRET
jgi:hypothetical protein